MDHEKVAGLVRELLREIGEDPKREGLIDTPKRVAASFEFLTSGYKANPRELIQRAIFVQETHNMVIARDIELYSLCEHHLLPFFGRCHIGYVAKDRVAGISKLARLVDLYARRLQIQERLTDQIAHSLMDELQAMGVGVTIEAQHLCMMMRGVEKQNSMMTTSAMLGSFRDSVATRTEFLTLIGRRRP
jgi:GTP cyclohydrolase IA